MFSIIHGSGRAWKTGKAWSHSSCEWTQGGHREEGPNCKNNALVHPFKRSTTVLDLRRSRGRNYSSSPVRNSLFKFIHTYLNIAPSPLCHFCVHLASTWRHTRDGWDQAFPVFRALPLPCIILNANRRTKIGWGLGTGLLYVHVSKCMHNWNTVVSWKSAHTSFWGNFLYRSCVSSGVAPTTAGTSMLIIWLHTHEVWI